MVDGMRLLNMLDCAHFRVSNLIGWILPILRWQTFLGKHLFSLLCQGGLGIKLASFFRTHNLLIHKLPWILRKHFSIIVLVKFSDACALRVLWGHLLILRWSLDELLTSFRVLMRFWRLQICIDETNDEVWSSSHMLDHSTITQTANIVECGPGLQVT